MTKAGTCNSAAFVAVHATAQGMHDAALMDKRTMREFDDYVSKWQRGVKAPAGKTWKLLLLAERKGLEAIA